MEGKTELLIFLSEEIKKRKANPTEEKPIEIDCNSPHQLYYIVV